MYSNINNDGSCLFTLHFNFENSIVNLGIYILILFRYLKHLTVCWYSEQKRFSHILPVSGGSPPLIVILAVKLTRLIGPPIKREQLTAISAVPERAPPPWTSARR